VQLSEVAMALEAESLVEGPDDPEIDYAGGSDSVSDVLVYGKPRMMLLTGLTQPSVIRAAQLMDVSAVVFVRGKRPDENVLEMARTLGVHVLLSPHSMYDSCGRLYVRGLPGVIPTRNPATNMVFCS
jgi:hypothetical protein